MDNRDQFISDLESRVKQTIESKFPIKSERNGKYEIRVENIHFKRPELQSIQNELNIKNAEGTLKGSVRGDIVIVGADGMEIDRKRAAKIVDLPYPSLRGTFIIGGNEKIIIGQNVSKNGAFVSDKGFEEAKADIRLTNYSGPGMSMSVKDGTLNLHIGNLNMGGIKFLEMVGFTQAEITDMIGNHDDLGLAVLKGGGGQASVSDVYDALSKNMSGTESPNKAQAIQDFFRRGVPLTEEESKTTQSTLGLRTESFNLSALQETIKKLMLVARDGTKEDSRDDLIYQTVKSPIDLIDGALISSINSFARSAANIVGPNRESVKYLATPMNGANSSFTRFFVKDQRVSDTEQTNPLHSIVEESTVVSTGPGGISRDALRNNDKPRNLKATGINRFDPVHTPESQKIGLSLRLAQDARIDSGTIKTKFLKVVNGRAEDNSNSLVELGPQEEYDAYVAFNSPRHVERMINAYAFTGKTTPGRYRGTLMDLPVEKIQYLDRRPQNLFGLAANLIPFGSHNDGNRMLMGANMQTQAVNVVNREEPLVQVDSGDGKTYEEIVGDKSYTVKAKVGGKVTDVQGNKISIMGADGNTTDTEIYDYFPLNRDHFLNNEPTVKVGDDVKEGQLIAEGWQTRNGKLALGMNARTAYMPYKGYNFEDGIVISEGFANRMISEDVVEQSAIIGANHTGGTGSGAKRLMKSSLNSLKSLDKLDEDGIIMVGAMVGPGDILVARLKKVEDADSDDLNQEQGILRSLFGGKDAFAGIAKYNDASVTIPNTSFTKGKVVRVKRSPGGNRPGDKETLSIEIMTQKTLKPGDKLSGRHGNKGVITKILADNEMPHDEEGKNVEIIFSPLAIPSRKNIGQLLEVNSGLIAEKTGQTQIVQSFDPDAKNKVLQKLQEIGIPDGKITLIDPETNKAYENNVTVGPMYIMKLKHKVDDKLQGRSMSEGSGPNEKYMGPEKKIGSNAGEMHNPQGVGEMELRALQAHGAVNNILEMTTLKGDGAGDSEARTKIYRVLAGRDDPSILDDYSSTPESLRIFKNYVTALGINFKAKRGSKELDSLDDPFDKLAITPHRDSDLIRMIGRNNEVKSAAKFYVNHNNEEKPETGGLFDMDIFGDNTDKRDPDRKKNREKWGYIKLNTAVPNPVFAAENGVNAYKVLTGLGEKEYKQLIDAGTHVLVTNPGDSGLGKNAVITGKQADELEIDGKLFEYKVGGDALESLLSEVNVKKEVSEAKSRLKELKGTDRDAEYTRYRILKGLHENGVEAKDLVTRVVPVLPQHLRPRISDGKMVISDDLNTLYSNMIITNNEAENVTGADVAAYATADDKLNVFNGIYKNYTELVGTSRLKDEKNDSDMKGIKQLLFGDGSSKEGLIRDRMLSKRVDYSGRAVIGVDPTLKMNEAVVPAEMARYIYKPFIVKELIDMGAASDTMEAEKLLENFKNPKVIKAMERAAKDRPVILNRAPSLHKFSTMAFDAKIKSYDDKGNPLRSIMINPLVTSGFNADFDGDQMAAHVPLTEAARKEAVKLMKPTDNLINPRNGEIAVEIKHEMLQGVYYLTMNADKPQTFKKFANVNALMDAYKASDVRIHDGAEINGRKTTVGQFVFNSVLPAKYQMWGVVVGKRELNAKLREMYEDPTMSHMDLSNIMDEVKRIGFEASTKSGMSIGILDFAKPNTASLGLDDALKAADEDLATNPGAYIAKYREMEEAIEKEYNKGDTLDKNNPVKIMMESGARGNAGQIRRMASTVGVGVDMLGNFTIPVTSSHIDGLMPQEYYTHAYDSRKGLSDRALGTADPGKITREVWGAVQDTVISEEDCRTRNGISKAVGNGIIGRFTSKAVPGVIGENKMVTKDMVDKLVRNSVTNIELRSPITCDSVKGVCKRCYGTSPGTLELPSKGSPIGIIASQSLGEPITQMTMNTFHTGGTSGGTSGGLPRVEQILNVSGKLGAEKAVLAKSSGIVSISPMQMGANIIVSVGGIEHKVRAGLPLAVKDGDYAERGDFLTLGSNKDFMDVSLTGNKNISFANADPNEVLVLNRGKGEEAALREAKIYTANTLDYAMAKSLKSSMGGAVDSRHLEIIADKLGDKVKVIDGGGSDYLPGQYISRKEADEWNRDATNNAFFDGHRVNVNDKDSIIGAKSAADIRGRGGDIVRKGEVIDAQKYDQILMAGVQSVKVFKKLIQYEAEMMGLKKAYHYGQENWFNELSTQNAFSAMGRAALMGKVDDLSAPASAQMAGIMQPIGSGFEKVKMFGSSLGKSLAGMFSSWGQ